MKENVGPDGTKVAFFDLSADHFPLKLTATLDTEDGELLWEQTIEPMVAITIPPASQEHRGRVVVKIETASGIVRIEKGDKCP